MITITTARTAVSFKIENPATDPARLDRIADALLHLGYVRQSERLAHEAQAIREGRP